MKEQQRRFSRHRTDNAASMTRGRSEDDMKIIDEQTRQAIAAYTGPVTRCPPGEPRAPKPVVKNAAVEWLIEHRDDVPSKAKRRRMRMALAAERGRMISEHNAPLLDRISEHDRVAQIGRSKR
jgi:hypothetical protein